MENGLSQVKNIVAVSSCKGGVGKSTVAVNLAFSMAKQGHKVGLFDADIYGPSLPTMLNLNTTEMGRDGDFLLPFIAENQVKCLSFGHIQEHGGPAILRGPIVTQIISQLLLGTQWGDLDYLILDMPPGTGDIQITLSQIVSIDAAVIVTTPQQLSFVDVEKGIQMFDEVQVPTIAVVENMAYYKVPNSDEKQRLFGKGVLRKCQTQFGISSSLTLPLEPGLSEAGDSGRPYVLTHENELTEQFLTLAANVHRETSFVKENQSRPSFDMNESGIVVNLPNNVEGVIHPVTLRAACRCAKCEDEYTGEKLLDVSKISPDIHPVALSTVGNYAVGIHWSDNHASIYPFAQLTELVKAGATTAST